MRKRTLTRFLFLFTLLPRVALRRLQLRPRDDLSKRVAEATHLSRYNILQKYIISCQVLNSHANSQFIRTHTKSWLKINQSLQQRGIMT